MSLKLKGIWAFAAGAALASSGCAAQQAPGSSRPTGEAVATPASSASSSSGGTAAISEMPAYLEGCEPKGIEQLPEHVFEWTSPGTSECPPLPAEPTRSPSEASFEPGPSSHSIANAGPVIARTRATFRACYQQALNLNSNAEGKIRLSLVVDCHGVVRKVTAAARGFDANTVHCVIENAAAATFEPPKGGGATLHVPLIFVKDTSCPAVPPKPAALPPAEGSSAPSLPEGSVGPQN